MNLYPYDSIQINGRNVQVRDITSGNSYASSEFEKSTFEFITGWLNGTRNFTQQTSGSTGFPKKITITRAQMIASATMTADALELKNGYCALLCLSPQYIAGKMMLVRSFVTGMKIIAVEPSGNPLKNLSLHQPLDFAAFVPYQLREILHSDQSRFLKSMRKIIVGGSTVDENIISDIQPYSCDFYATYGMTETISHIALRRLNGRKASEDFTTLNGISVELDERGCLIIGWSHLHDKVVTNDLAELTQENSFRWLGRWDNVINTGGIKVIPERLELSISKIFDDQKIDRRFFVGGLLDEKLGSKVVLFVEGSLNPDVREQLQKIMNGTISKYECPKDIVTFKSFVFTENGKINRKGTINLHRVP